MNIKVSFFFFFVLGLTLQVSAQKTGIDRFFDLYAEENGLLNLTISGNLLKEVLDCDEDDEVAMTQARNITRLRIISSDDQKHRIKSQDITRLKADLSKEDFEELMHIKDEGNLIRVMGRGDGGDIFSQLVLLIDNPDNFTLLSFEGKLDLSKMGKTCENLEINGSKVFQDMDEE